MTVVDAVLFDLDGTLVDSRAPFAQSINDALVAHGHPAVPEEGLHQYLGPPIAQTFATLLGAGSPDVESCIDAYRVAYEARMLTDTPVFPGIRELLDRLSGAGFVLGVATSKPQPLAQRLIESLGLRERFVTVTGPALTAHDESKAVTVGRALQALPAGAQAVMVGDRRHDVEGAHAHGLRAIGVLWGIGARDELLDAGADALIAAPPELDALL